MSRKQAVSLTSAILMVALITNIVGWVHNAEAHPHMIVTQNVTHACVDTDHTYQSDICQAVQFTVIVELYPDPHPDEHGQFQDNRNVYISTGVTSCSQCPNPPFYHY